MFVQVEDPVGRTGGPLSADQRRSVDMISASMSFFLRATGRLRNRRIQELDAGRGKNQRCALPALMRADLQSMRLIPKLHERLTPGSAAGEMETSRHRRFLFDLTFRAAAGNLQRSESEGEIPRRRWPKFHHHDWMKHWPPLSAANYPQAGAPPTLSLKRRKNCRGDPTTRGLLSGGGDEPPSMGEHAWPWQPRRSCAEQLIGDGAVHEALEGDQRAAGRPTRFRYPGLLPVSADGVPGSSGSSALRSSTQAKVNHPIAACRDQLIAPGTAQPMAVKVRREGVPLDAVSSSLFAVAVSPHDRARRQRRRHRRHGSAWFGQARAELVSQRFDDAATKLLMTIEQGGDIVVPEHGDGLAWRGHGRRRTKLRYTTGKTGDRGQRQQQSPSEAAYQAAQRRKRLTALNKVVEGMDIGKPQCLAPDAGPAHRSSM
uniref:hypothetical protein n=1 Tax=Rhizobium sp. F40D2 TaxID=3453141 RepID=UPI003F28B636